MNRTPSAPTSMPSRPKDDSPWVGKSREEFAATWRARDFARKLKPVKLPTAWIDYRDLKQRPTKSKAAKPAEDIL